MSNEEIIKYNAILILEQKKEIDNLKTILRDISRELPVDYTELEGIERLPDLARYWVNIAQTSEQKWKELSQELRSKWRL